MKAKLTVRGFKINGDKYAKAINDALDVQIRQAARAWLRAVYPLVPVWSGMARGSLIPLGQYLKVAIPIERDIQSLRQHGYAWRTQHHGASLGKFEFQHLKTLVRFSFSTNVEHYIINEEFDVSNYIHLRHPTPWKSFEAGKSAFDQYLADNLKGKIPKILDFRLEYQYTYP